MTDKFTGPWIDTSKVPELRRSFDMNRDPYIREQLLAMEKTEAQRREEQGRGSGMIEQDKPEPHFKPPSEIRKPVERQDFEDRWLAEHRDAAMAQAHTSQSGNERSQEYQLTRHQLSR